MMQSRRGTPGMITHETPLADRRESLPAFNLAAQTLGRLARGKPKHYSAAELALRSQRLALARLKRWPKRVAIAPRIT